MQSQECLILQNKKALGKLNLAGSWFCDLWQLCASQLQRLFSVYADDHCLFVHCVVERYQL